MFKAITIGKTSRRVLMCAVLTLVAALMMRGNGEATGVFKTAANSSSKKLPIYSVETDEKKVSVTFDAAWADVV